MGGFLSRPLRSKHLVDGLQQHGDLQRLGYVVVGAGRRAGLDMFGAAIGGRHDDRGAGQVARGIQGSDSPGRRHA